MWSHTEEAALRALLSFLAAMMAAPRFCTVEMNSPLRYALSFTACVCVSTNINKAAKFTLVSKQAAFSSICKTSANKYRRDY